MKILLITSLYPVEGISYWPETTNAIHDLVKYWTNDHDVMCIVDFRHTVTRPGLLLHKETILNLSGVDYCYTKDSVSAYLLEHFHIPMQNQMNAGQVYRYSERINKILKESSFAPDIVVAHMPLFGDIITYIDKINVACPKAAVLHCSDCKAKNINDRVRQLAVKFDIIFTRSQSIYRFFSGYNLKNLVKKPIYSGVPQITREHKRSFKNLKQRKVKLLYAGSLIKQKGVSTILQGVTVIAQETDFVLDIIGVGKEENQLKKQVKQNHLNNKVNFWGKCSRDKVYEKMGNADIFIMVSANETLGLVYLEAMRNGCIVIGSRNEGIDGIIINGVNGFLVDALNASQLADCLRDILTMPESQLTAISEQAVETGKYYNESDISDYYLQQLKKVRKSSLTAIMQTEKDDYDGN